MLTLGSLFDGSGGFPLGGIIAGIKPVWAAEIEPFPIRVTTKRFPDMKHYGDVSAINGGEIEPVDIITFGSPCQDMSVAGKRAGLDGERSNLFYEAIRIVKEMRVKTNGIYPRFLVWENVPGAFTSNSGEDFRCVLESVCSVKEAAVSIPKPERWLNAGNIVGEGYSVAWRVLDAQYWGVPQRRKRIYLVADFADECAAGKILFESESLSGYSAESFRAWQRAAGAVEERFNGSSIGIDGYNGAIGDVAATLGINCGISTGRNGVIVSNNQPLAVYQKKRHPRSAIEGQGYKEGVIAATLNTHDVSKTWSNEIVVDSPSTPKTLKIRSGCEGGMIVIEGNGSRPSHKGDGFKEDNVMYTINTIEKHGIAYGIDRATFNMGKNAKFDIGVRENVGATVTARGPAAVGQPVYTMSKLSRHTRVDKNIANTLTATEYKEPPTLGQPVYTTSHNDYHIVAHSDAAACLESTDYKDPPTITQGPQYIVRRLTPIECARLQGFPDWWCAGLKTAEPTAEDIKEWSNVFETYRKATNPTAKPKTDKQIIKWLQEPYSDSAEYKMWGNGVALPCVFFVMAGIAWAAEKEV